MKKLVLITTAAIMLFAGCSRNEVLEFPEEQASPVDFTTYVGRARQIKGTSLDLEGLKDKDFGVYAFYKENAEWTDYGEEDKKHPNFMNNVRVYRDESLSYDNILYWPVELDESGDYADGNLYFFDRADCEMLDDL